MTTKTEEIRITLPPKAEAPSSNHRRPSYEPRITLPPKADASTPIKPSRVYLAAWIAADAALPAASKALIEAHDEKFSLWRKEGYPTPSAILEAVRAAGALVEADPLGKFVMDLRRKTNEASHEEWRAEQSAKEVA